MNLPDIKYFELSFINNKDEIKRQLLNTILFLNLSKNNELTSLSDYIENTQYGFTASAKKAGKVKFLRITDINEGRVNWDNVPFCDCDNLNSYKLKENDILVARTGGTTGKSFMVKDITQDSVFASYLIRLRVASNNNPKFIYLFLNSYFYWSQLVELKRGAAQPNVNAEKLKRIVIPKCSPELQNKYVSFLEGNYVDDTLKNDILKVTNLFDEIQQLHVEHDNQHSILNNLRQQILLDAVQGKLVPQDPNDEPASKLLERIKAEKEELVKQKKIKKEKPLPPIKPEEKQLDIPDSWVWCRLSEITEITGGGTPSMNNSEYWNGSIPWISPKDMCANEINDSEMKITREGLDNSAARLIPQGSLLIVGRSGILKRKLPVAINLIPCAVNQDMKVLIPHFHSMNLYLQLILFGMEKWILKRLVKFGMTVHSLRYDEFALMPIPLPPLSEQHRIVEKINQLMQYCDELEKTIRQNQSYTQELLQVVLKEALAFKKSN